MTTSHPKITSHQTFRAVSQEFSNPYPPYVLVNSQDDANLVLSAGCELGYLLVLETDGPSGSRILTLNQAGEYRGRIGIIIYTLPTEMDLGAIADQILPLLAIGGTAIGFAPLQQLAPWKEACFAWAKVQETSATQDKSQGGVGLEWADNNASGSGDQWAQWSVVKKAPEWAFC
ncbi:hypothetical protein RHS03_07879, partial [Rhizoctonia solani]